MEVRAAGSPSNHVCIRLVALGIVGILWLAEIHLLRRSCLVLFLKITGRKGANYHRRGVGEFRSRLCRGPDKVNPQISPSTCSLLTQQLRTMTPTSWASLPRTRVLAQLTVFDARHGDCNLLDYCLDPYGDITDRKSWVRTLIDTGTNKDSIRASVVEGITSVGFPRPPNIEAGQMPYNNVDEIVITHADEDHIGNAGNIMSYLSEALLRNCRVLMPGPGPNVYPKPSIVRTASEWHLNFTGNGKAFAAGDEGVNVARFQAVLEAGWRDMMTRGFAVDVTFSSTPLDWTTHGAEWVRNTGAVPFSDQQLTLVYSKRFTGSDMASLIIQVACQVTLHTPRWKEDPTKEPAKGNKKRKMSR